MNRLLSALLFVTALGAGAAAGQGFPHNAALAGSPTGGLVFSPPGGAFTGTQYVGLSYPADSTASIFYAVGPQCTPTNCPAGSRVLTLASSLYTGPSCVPTSGCTTGNGGFGTPIKAPVTGSGTTITALVASTLVAQQNNLSPTSLPANWFPGHWKFITPNTIIQNSVTKAISGQIVTLPASGNGCNGSCTGNALVPANLCYTTFVDQNGNSISPPSGYCKGGGVGTLNTVLTAWVIPNVTPPVTAPIDDTTGLPAEVTYIGFSSSSQDEKSYGHPQILYTEKDEQNCGATSTCTWQQMDFWILADGSSMAGWESDMQMGDSQGSWTSALQCRVHGNASPLTAGWGYGNQTSGLTQISGTSTSNCPSSTAWLHVMYLTTFQLSAGTYTIQSLTLQSNPGGPAGSTGYVQFTVNHTYSVDPTDTVGVSCTNQMQLDQWCSATGVCNTTQTAGAYYALNRVSCGTGMPPTVSATTQTYHQ